MACLTLSTSAQDVGAGDASIRTHETVPDDLAERRERLHNYLASRRARLDIVATTKTDSGQVIDWILRDTQGHSGHVASPPALERMVDEGDEAVSFELTEQLRARGPAGTVPVLRRDVDEVLNGRLPVGIDDFLSKYGHAADRCSPFDGLNSGLEQPGTSDHEYVFTDQARVNFGGHGNINVWDPYVYKSGEFSLGQVAVARSANGSAMQTIEAGWQDYKNLYGDNVPHLFVYFTTNAYASQGDNVGGYNMDVDGFVQYSSTAFPGMKLESISSIGGVQHSIHIRVQLHAGNWWIRAGKEWVGYYPAKLFSANGLRNKADRISWFGEVVDMDDGVNSYTDMGSGQFASMGWRFAAYMRNVRVYDFSDKFSHEYDPDTTWESDPGCYSLDDHSLSGTNWGSFFWFGGPGKNSGCK